jgi:excisionase family DNA binding protein
VTEGTTQDRRPGQITAGGLYSKRDLAELLGVTVRTIERMAESGELPPAFDQGRRRYWLGETLLEHFRTRQEKAIAEVEAFGG